MNAQELLQIETARKVEGLIVTLKGKAGGKLEHYSFYSRYFAPWNGVPEDPVTGLFGHA